MEPTSIVQQLIRNENLQGVPATQLQWLAEHCELRELQADDHLLRSGEPIDYLLVMLKGHVRMFMMQGDQQREFGQMEKDDIGGVLPYSRMATATGDALATEPTTVLMLHRDRFPEMIHTQHELTETLVHRMLNRVRNFTKLQQQNEKMISLGKLSAGLSHELNNPAAAIVRGASALKKHLSNVPEKFKQVISMRLTPAQVDQVNDVLFTKLEKGAETDLPMMQKTAREDELADWLEAHGMEAVYEMAETFTEYGFTTGDLDFVRTQVSGEFTEPVLRWLENVLTTEKMVNEIQEASNRIATLIDAVKSYSHMDGGGDKRQITLRDGIQSTLTMLHFKLKTKHITVTVAMPDDLPKVNANPGEMNQVWTNLIDNAIDALEDGGQLRIEARQEREFVITDIIDNGSGIPAERVDLIFDPFFTTKEIGKGTGLGLDIVKRIIQQHNGKVSVESQPGRTVLSVCLPVE